MKNKIQIRQSSEKTDTTRLRPEHIEVGECTEMEARELLQAMVTGHDGCEVIRRHPAIKPFGAVGGGMSSRWIRLSTLAEKDFGNVIITDPKGELITQKG